MIAIILAFLKDVPIKVWLALAATLVAFVLLAQYNAHEREIGREQSAKQIAALQAQIAVDKAANDSLLATVSVLQGKLSACEDGRVVDQRLQAQAKAAYSQQLDVLKHGADAARTRTNELLAGDCKVWATQPACGVTVIAP